MRSATSWSPASSTTATPGRALTAPALTPCVTEAQAGVFERVWVLTPDRLARNFAYQMLVLDELGPLRRRGVLHRRSSPR